jgi:Protein of unknown function (DUF2971)
MKLDYDGELEAFKAKISSMINADTKAAEVNAPHQPTIYHYTDVKGALGILESGELWLTERAHLNDPVEVQYGLCIAQKLFENTARNSSARIPNDAASHLKEEHETGLARLGFWIFSASLNDNDLGQWRSYADDGRGVCLGFSIEKFDMKELAKRNIPYALNARQFSVRYCESSLMTSMKRYIDNGITTLEKLKLGEQDRDAWRRERYFWLILNDGIYVNSTLYKHKAYDHEQEYRLLIIGERDKIAEECDRHHVRERNREIVGYLKLPIPSWGEPGVLTHIRIGPAAPYQLADQIRITLKKLRIPLPVVIDKSDIPYRPTR